MAEHSQPHPYARAIFDEVRAAAIALSLGDKMQSCSYARTSLFRASMKREISRRDILRLAAETDLDPRTVKRAVERGIDQMQATVDKERIRAAAKKLKIAIE